MVAPGTCGRGIDIVVCGLGTPHPRIPLHFEATQFDERAEIADRFGRKGEWKLMEMLEMAGLFEAAEWSGFRGGNRLKRVISGTCNGNVDWRAEARVRNDFNETEG